MAPMAPPSSRYPLLPILQSKTPFVSLFSPDIRPSILGPPPQAVPSFSSPLLTVSSTIQICQFATKLAADCLLILASLSAQHLSSLSGQSSFHHRHVAPWPPSRGCRSNKQCCPPPVRLKSVGRPVIPLDAAAVATGLSFTQSSTPASVPAPASSLGPTCAVAAAVSSPLTASVGPFSGPGQKKANELDKEGWSVVTRKRKPAQTTPVNKLALSTPSDKNPLPPLANASAAPPSAKALPPPSSAKVPAPPLTNVPSLPSSKPLSFPLSQPPAPTSTDVHSKSLSSGKVTFSAKATHPVKTIMSTSPPSLSSTSLAPPPSPAPPSKLPSAPLPQIPPSALDSGPAQVVPQPKTVRKFKIVHGVKYLRGVTARGMRVGAPAPVMDTVFEPEPLVSSSSNRSRELSSSAAEFHPKVSTTRSYSTVVKSTLTSSDHGHTSPPPVSSFVPSSQANKHSEPQNTACGSSIGPEDLVDEFFRCFAQKKKCVMT